MLIAHFAEFPLHLAIAIKRIKFPFWGLHPSNKPFIGQ